MELHVFSQNRDWSSSREVKYGKKNKWKNKKKCLVKAKKSVLKPIVKSTQH